MTDKMRAKIRAEKRGFAVWSERGDYTGPVAHIYHNKEWLWIETDEYEGSAMVNIETLPMLIRALSKLRSALRAEGKAK